MGDSTHGRSLHSRASARLLRSVLIVTAFLAAVTETQLQACADGQPLQPSLCRCSRAGGGDRTVDCSGLGLDGIPDGIPEDTVILNLTGNLIANIEQSFLQVAPRLRTLVLSDNRLTCGCNLLWFQNWLLNKRWTDFDVQGARCFTPSSVSQQDVESAIFCKRSVQTCYICDQESTNNACNQTQSCDTSPSYCENEVRRVNSAYIISKRCQQLEECLANSARNEQACNSGSDNSVCFYCCRGTLCNAPESTIQDGYSFFPPDIKLATSTAPPTSFNMTAPPTTILCPPEMTSGVAGIFTWPQTPGGEAATVRCPYNTTEAMPRLVAVRQCVNGSWNEADTSECPTAAQVLEELARINITKDNVVTVSERLNSSSSVPDVLTSNDVTNVAVTSRNLANAPGVGEQDGPVVFRNVLAAVDRLSDVPVDRLVESQLNNGSSSSILRTIDDFTSGVLFPGDVLVANMPSVDVVVLSVRDLGQADSEGVLFFGEGKKSGDAQPRFNVNSSGDAGNGTTEEGVVVRGSLLIPNSVLASVGDRLMRVQFVMHEETTFFDVIKDANRNGTLASQQDEQTLTTDSSGSATDCLSNSCREGRVTIINSVVISGSIGDLNVTDLDDPVEITFRKNTMEADRPRCVYWEETQNDGRGGWSDRGCYVDTGRDDDFNIYCRCNHLTNFALLMDVVRGDYNISKADEVALSVISYVGCSLSLIGLVATLITYTCCGSRSLNGPKNRSPRADKRFKVLINFVISLILVNTFFIAGSVTVEFHGDSDNVDQLCTSLAVCLHYSLLAAMAWMAIEAFDVFMALVQVFEKYYAHFLLRIMLVGWGVPFIIVVITLVINLKNYGYYNKICWLATTPFYVAFLAPIILVLIFNSIVFCLVTRKLYLLRKSNVSQSDRFDLMSQLKASASITFLLGLTWIFGIFAIGKATLPFYYLFALFNTLQGFFVFVFQCVLNSEIRQRWRALCCASFAKSKIESRTSDSTHQTKKTNINTGTATSSFGVNTSHSIH